MSSDLLNFFSLVIVLPKGITLVRADGILVKEMQPLGKVNTEVEVPLYFSFGRLCARVIRH